MLTPSRLALARQRRGLSLAELGRRVGLRPATISSYERGDTCPDAEIIVKIADVLSVPMVFLEGSGIEAVHQDVATFRALWRTSASRRESALAVGRLAIELGDWIDARFVLPRADVPTLSTQHMTPEQAAEVVRARWGLGAAPVSNMVHLLEAHGVRVFALPSDTLDVDAFAMWWRATPYVLLNLTKSGERGRFDAAHELGHLVLHGDTLPTQSRLSENEANSFASAFLMPASAIRSAGLYNATVDRILDEKKLWKVAAMALTYRLHDLGLIGEWSYRTSCQVLSQMGYRRQERGGARRESSQLLTKVFSSLREEGLSMNEIAHELDWSPDMLRDLVLGLTPSVIEGGRLTYPPTKGHLALVEH